MPDEEPNVHPTRSLLTPDGTTAHIDVEMIPVVRALWSAGLTTVGCCQDSGEYAEAARNSKPDREPTGHAGYVEYFRGWAWLKMPVSDATALTNALAETSFRRAVTVRWQKGSWRVFVPVVHEEGSGMRLAPHAQIYLPYDQLNDLSKVVSKLSIEMAAL
ncbi:hypothetical protein ACFVH6_23480 [Spirillospora sp. NPDC127200]